MIDLDKECKRLRETFHRLEGEQQGLLKQWAASSIEVKLLETRNNKAIKARGVIQVAARKTQENLKYHITDLITSSLAAIFPHPYEAVVDIVERRNGLECDIKLRKGGEECDPIDAAGGGVCDVVSFFLKVGYLLLKKRKNARLVIIADEPFSYLHSPVAQKNCSELLHIVCEKKGVQIIMVSDQSEITAYADRHFRCKQEKGVSIVTVQDKQTIEPVKKEVVVVEKKAMRLNR